MTKKRKKRFNKRQMKDIKEAWLQLQKDRDYYFTCVKILEEWMVLNTGIPDIEFVVGADGDFCGVGTASRSHGLVQLDDDGNVYEDK